MALQTISPKTPLPEEPSYMISTAEKHLIIRDINNQDGEQLGLQGHAHTYRFVNTCTAKVGLLYTMKYLFLVIGEAFATEVHWANVLYKILQSLL